MVLLKINGTMEPIEKFIDEGVGCLIERQGKNEDSLLK